MHKKIQLFCPVFNVEECLKEIRECLEIGWTGIGFKAFEFEEEWKKYTNLPNAHFLNSTTAGLHTAIAIFKRALKWRDGDEIITTPFTFVATNHPILYENLKPVFADIDETLCLSPQSVKERITPKTRAVIFVGIGGNAGLIDDVVSICKEKNLILILDAAHMAGTKYNGIHIGANADCSVFSFQATKNLPTGDAGMVCFKETELDKEARKFCWLGINEDTYTRTRQGYKWLYDVEDVGIKGHGNSIMAAIALVQLKELETHNEFRRKLCKLYDELLVKNTKVRLIRHYDNCVSSRHLFQIRVEKNIRNELVKYLNTKNIFPGVHYQVNTFYPMFRYGAGTCPNAELASQEIISLPLHLKLNEDDIRYVSDCILDFFN